MQIRLATVDDLDRLVELERQSYPADEAASREMFRYRLLHAGDCFTVGEIEGRAVGLVCGTRARGAALTHSSMSEHVDDGETLCIHSVVVARDQRRRGLALRLLDDYRERASALTGLERLALICKRELIPLYQKAGFRLIGPSPVEHGRDPWFEMQLGL